MANSTESSGELVTAELEIVDNNSTLSPDFIEELLPSAEQTALLYHLTFLSLGGFPELECVIRDNAIETQLLFGSSEALLFKCVATSSNLVTTLFPILKKAVEKNKPKLAEKYLMKAKVWITDIVSKVDDIVKRYDQHNESVKTCSKKVTQEKKEYAKSPEMKGLEDDLAKIKMDLEQIVDKIKIKEEEIKKTNDELNDFFRRFKDKHGHWTMKFLNFFRGNPDAMKDPSAIAMDMKLKQLNSDKNSLRNEEWDIKIKQTDLQLQLANCKIRMGEIPEPDNLNEVQQCLSQIQQILIELDKFWKKVEVILDALKDKTFAGDELLEDMEDMKEEFLSSIEDAGKYWKRFGMSCQRAHGIFSVQSRDAYKFLEINPSSLSEEERQKEYLSITEKLRNIKVGACPELPSCPSDTQI